MDFTLGRLSFKYEKLPKEVAIIEGDIIYPNEGLPHGGSDSQFRIKENSRYFNATKRVIHEGHSVFTIVWRDAGKYPWQAKV